MKIVAIEPVELAQHLGNISADGMEIFTLENDTVRGAILNASTMVNQMRANHGLGIIETIALGHGYIATLLCTMQLKGNDRIRYEIACEGSMTGMSVEANAHGQVRGYLAEPVFPIYAPLDDFSLDPFIKAGRQTLTRLPEGTIEPFSGTSQLCAGGLAMCLSKHFRDSEQTHTAFAFSVHFSPKGWVLGAGGIFLQAMPGASETILDDLEEWLPQLPSLAKSLSEGSTSAAYLHQHFGAFGPHLMGIRPVEFTCSCSHAMFVSYFSAMDIDKRRELASAGPMPMEVQCHNCCSRYQLYEIDLGI